MPKKEKMKVKPKRKAPSTQRYLPISEIKDDVVVLKDGTLRKVLLISSINFALKNEEEQQAVINGYVQFLNTIEDPIQIVIQSRKLDIREYIDNLKKLSKVQTNELLKIQTSEYTIYIEQMVELAQIMEKRFYVVVSYSPYSKKQRKSYFSRVQDVFSPGRVIKLKQDKLKKYKEELNRRSSIVTSGLTSIGLKVAALDTQSLIELYFQMYNPHRGNQKKVGILEKIRTERKDT